MEYLILFGRWVAQWMDYPLYWMLSLPRDVAVLIVGVGTSLIMTLVRYCVTNQDRMRRCKQDLARLTRIRRSAERRRSPAWLLASAAAVVLAVACCAFGPAMLAETDGQILTGRLIHVPGVILGILFGLLAWLLYKKSTHLSDKALESRLAATEGMINMARMKAELVGLAFSIVPVILLASWAFERLDFFPHQPGEEIRLRAKFPLHLRGGIACLLPDERITPCSPALAEIVTDDNVDPMTGIKLAHADCNGIAEWKIKAAQTDEPIDLKVVYRLDGRRQVLDQPVLVGRKHYATPFIFHDPPPGSGGGDPAAADIYLTEVPHRQAWFMGWAPGMDEFWRNYIRVQSWAPGGKQPATEPNALLRRLKGFRDTANSFAVTTAWAVTRITLFSPWLIAYLAITIPFVPLLRKTMKIY